MLKEETLISLLNNFYGRFNNRTFRRTLAGLWIAITLLFGYQLTKLQVDFEFEKFFPTDDPDIAFYENHLEVFGYDNDYVIIILENQPSVFNLDFLKSTIALSESLSEVKYVEKVVNPVEIKQLVQSPLGIATFPIINLQNESSFGSDSIRIYSHPIYKSFFSDDGSSLLIHLTHSHLKDPNKTNQFINEINTALALSGFTDTRLIGKLIAQEEFIDYIKRDFVKFIVLALLVCLVLLIIIFRSPRVALLPYLISLTSLIWLLGLMAWIGEPITILGSLIPPVILFVSTSDAIHLIKAYQRVKAQVTNKLSSAIQSVLMPTALTSITTAIGFVSLVSIDTSPIRSLGVFTGIGIIIAFLVTFIFSPLLLTNQQVKRAKFINFKRLSIFILRHQKQIVVVNVVLILVSIFGISQLKVDAYLLDDLPSDSQVNQDFTFMDQTLGGSKPWEIACWPKDSTKKIWELSVMNEIHQIHQYLKSEYPIAQLNSPVSFIQYGNQMTNGGASDAFIYPSEDQYLTAQRSVRHFINKDQSPNLVSKNSQYARLVGFIPEYGSLETIRRNEVLLSYLDKNVDQSILSYRLTGTTYLIDKSHDSLSFHLLRGLIIAIGIIGIILGLYFRSFKILIISLLPNIIPLLITAGYMGITGISLKLTTSIIFTVAFGIAVDDTIHFIAKYRQIKSTNRIYQLIATFRSAGSAIVTTSVIIMTGFALFLFSSFGATFYLGLFLTLALSSALLIDLTLLPILLHLSKNKSSK